jgi:DedD protein
VAEQDDDLELKKRARRRLVGAVAFAVLAVALLPTVMDEEPPRVGADIAIRIPGQDEPRSTPLAAAPESSPTPAQGSPKPAESAPAGAADDKEAPVSPARPEAPRTEPAKPAETPKPAAKESSPPAAEAHRAQAILDGAAANTEYVLLIGAYANQANVKALTAKLADLGIKTYTETVSLPQGKRTRVRAGPFASRAAAEAAQDRMKRIGVNGQLAVRP